MIFRLKVWILVFILGTLAAVPVSAASKGGVRLDDKQLAALFSVDLNFYVEFKTWAAEFEFRADGSWMGENTGQGLLYGLGRWHIINKKICDEITGGYGLSWEISHCFGIERRGNRLFYVESTLPSSYEGKEIELEDESFLARLDNIRRLPKVVQGKRLKPGSVQVVTRPPATKNKEREDLQSLHKEKTDTDNIPPVIETPTSITTERDTALVTGTIRDGSQIKTVLVNGKSVEFRTSDGSFAVETPVPMGRSTVRIAAIDVQGNRSERELRVFRKVAAAGMAFGDYYALVIGIDDYKGLPVLKTAIADARSVASTLENKYGFTVTLLTNASRDDIITALDRVRRQSRPTDNLLIYYAGHGWLDDDAGRGYWLPIDAVEDSRRRWLSNADITDTLKAVKAKHVMVVADSCYSGTLTRSTTRGIKVGQRPPDYITRTAMKRSRTVLASGGLEPVVDSGGGKHSVFAKAFLDALNDNTDILDGTRLFMTVREQVLLNARQTPQYQNIRFAGHEVGGDFLFVRRK